VWHAREIVHQSSAALRLERWLARRFATRVIAISEAVAAQLDATNVVVIVDDPDPAEFRPSRAGVFRAKAGISDQTLLVGAVGRIDTWKGFDVLLDAVPAIRTARPGAQVVIAGGTVQGKEAYAARLACRARVLAGVRWLGPRADIPDLLADLDVLVLPSTEPEPFGLVVVEALTSGVPVVATDAGGPREILRQAGRAAGQLIAPGDPGALARATVELLPTGPSSTIRRRARPRLRHASPPRFGPVFEEAVETGR
jgi:glycosyltransferase involved in cell wall biosynthesis